MLVPRRLAPAIAAICCLALAACGDDEGDDTATSASAAPGGELFTLTASGGTLTPVQGENDVFDLTLTGAAANVTEFSDRPIRQASSESLSDFVENWPERGFDQDPPNAALVLDQEPENADTSVFELADPRYDQASEQITYRATSIEGGTSALPGPDEEAAPPERFGHSHLFIDPGDTPTSDFSLEVQGARFGRHTIITLDSQFAVFVGPDQKADWFTDQPTGGIIGGQTIDLSGSGDVGVAVTGASPPITGTAQVPSGASVNIQIGNGPQEPISNGRFSVGG